MPDQKALSTQQVAAMLHVSCNTVYELIRRGEINSYRVGRKVRFTKEDVDQYIARSRHECSAPKVKTAELEGGLITRADWDHHFIIAGQDVVLDLLSSRMQQKNVAALRAYLSGFEGLLALYQKRIHAAMVHLWAGDLDRYNSPYVRRLMPGVGAVLVNVSRRMQGFYVAAGNPKQITGWEDLCREDVCMLNRGCGSASRVLLDEHLRRLGIAPSSVRGYDQETGSHLTLAGAIAQGKADVGVGTERVTRKQAGLDFIPMQQERCDLVLRKDSLEQPEVQTLLAVLRDPAFRRELEQFSGNDYTQMGEILEEV